MKLRAKDFASSLWLILGIIVALIIIINDWVRAASIAVNAVGLVIVYASVYLIASAAMEGPPRPRRPILFVLFGILYLVTWPVIIGRALARHHTFDAICFSLLAVGAFIWLGIYCGIFFNRR
jgi:hypothetical protein